MDYYKNKKFIASYSGGKDSTLAIYKAIQQGMEPIGLITTYNKDRKKSWFHGIPTDLLKKISEQINIPIDFIITSGEMYRENFVNKLKSAREQGAEFCVFGDIDIEGHIKWCTDVCNDAGIKAYFPLLHESRKKIVYDFINLGFKSMITTVDNSRLDDKFLGKVLSIEVVDEIEKSGADICGENGEYHTFTYDGPLFSNPVTFSAGEIIYFEKYSILPIK